MGLLEVHFDSSRIPGADQLRRWREVTTSLFYTAERDPLHAATPFVGRLASREFGAMRVLHVSCPAMTSSREQVARTSGGPGSVYLSFMKSGQASMKVSDQLIAQRTGDIAVWDGDLAHSWTFHGPIEALCIRLPKALLGFTQIDRCTGLTLAHGDWMTDSVSTLINSAANVDTPPQRSVAFRLQEALVNAAMAAWDHHGKRQILAPRRSPLGQAQAYIQARLADPDLSAADVAQAVHVSLRTLNRQFARIDTSPAAWIWRQRLETARKMLQEPDRPSVTEVAFSCGFKSPSHFSHAFKNAYKVAPAKIERG
jgi:AraC-like DNA-binding protein